MAIREAATGDEAGIARVHTRSWQVAYRGQLPDAMLDALDVDARAESWAHLLSDPAVAVLVDEDDHDGIVGFVAVGGSRDEDAPSDTGEVRAIYVDPPRWGRGTGSRLLSAGLERLAAAGSSRATLWVLASNHRTRGFYEDRGWSRDGHAKSDRRGDVTLVELRYARPVGATRDGDR